MENEVRLKIEPKVSLKDYLLWNSWMIVLGLLLIIITIIFSLVGMPNLREFDVLIQLLMKLLRIGILIIVPIAYVYKTVTMYLHTGKISYTFYKDFVRFEDNFLNKESKDILYKNIIEVVTEQRIWARVLNVGNIFIRTNVELKAGIHIPYVENPKETVAQIRKIISEAGNEKVNK